MTWKRGLLRPWVVCSLLWLVIATPVIVSFFSTNEQFVEAANKTGWEADPSPFACLGGTITRTVWHWPPWWAFAIEAAVPLLLLGIGATLYWIVAGFRRSS